MLSVSVAPPKCDGSTIITIMPNLLISSLSASENASTANFVMVYAAQNGKTHMPLTELTFTIRPEFNNRKNQQNFTAVAHLPRKRHHRKLANKHQTFATYGTDGRLFATDVSANFKVM